MEKCAIFIDEGCLRSITKENGYIDLDYQRLSNYLANGTTILRSYFYGCLPYKHPYRPTADELLHYDKKERYYAAIGRLVRFSVRTGRLQKKGVDETTGEPVYLQKGVDVNLAADLVKLSCKNLISKAVILANDSDFVPAIEIAKGEGVEIKLVFGDNDKATIHQSMLDLADETEILEWSHLNVLQRRTAPAVYHRRGGVG